MSTTTATAKQSHSNGEPGVPILDSRVALLLNYVTRHQLYVFEELDAMVGDLRVLVSVAMEPQRDYDARYGRLQVVQQKNITLNRKWKHDDGFEDRLNVQLPVDTYTQLSKIRPDIVVSYELGLRSILSGMYRVTHPRSRLVLCQNISEVTEKSWGMSRRLIRPWLLRTADAITYNGPSCRRYLESIVDRQDNLFHFPYAAAPEQISTTSEYREPIDRRRLLYIGQLTERKNPVRMFEQLAAWARQHPDQTVNLSVVGRGPLRESLEATKLPENFRVNWIGSVQPDEIPSIFKDHGILVFPTLADEWGMVVNEAMQSGLVPCASRSAQAAESLVRCNENGWLFDPNSDSSIYKALDAALSCPFDQLNRMASLARSECAIRTPQYAAECLYAALANVQNHSVANPANTSQRSTLSETQ